MYIELMWRPGWVIHLIPREIKLQTISTYMCYYVFFGQAI